MAGGPALVVGVALLLSYFSPLQTAAQSKYHSIKQHHPITLFSTLFNSTITLFSSTHHSMWCCHDMTPPPVGVVITGTDAMAGERHDLICTYSAPDTIPSLEYRWCARGICRPDSTSNLYDLDFVVLSDAHDQYVCEVRQAGTDTVLGSATGSLNVTSKCSDTIIDKYRCVSTKAASSWRVTNNGLWGYYDIVSRWGGVGWGGVGWG